MQKKIIESLRSYVVITLGLFIFSMGWTAFLIPSEITGGGISGLAAVIFFVSGFPVAGSYAIINAFLLLIALRILGFKYGIKTVFGVGILSLFFAVFQPMITEPVVKEPFMACVIGGMMSGIGTGLVFNGGGSTGGTDIIASVVNKYRNIGPGRIMLMCDVIIIGSTYFVFGSLEKIVYGLTAMAVASYTIDLILNGMKQSIQFHIFSSKYAEIADGINKDLHRGVTVIEGLGWYSQKPVKIVLVVARKNEARDIFRMVKSIDPTAFISQGSVMGAYGEGFEAIKA